MLPIVDICFKGLMNNARVRQGFIAALLDMEPETIRRTTLLPTVLVQDYPDVRVELEDKTQIDMEMQVAYFEYWDARSGGDIIKWMKFLGGKTREEFRDMAKTDEYIEEAYKELEKLSADDRARLEYEARECAIRDYNSQMNSALKRGLEQGRLSIIIQMMKNGMDMEDVARLSGATEEEIERAEKSMR